MSDKKDCFRELGRIRKMVRIGPTAVEGLVRTTAILSLGSEAPTHRIRNLVPVSRYAACIQVPTRPLSTNIIDGQSGQITRCERDYSARRGSQRTWSQGE